MAEMELRQGTLDLLVLKALTWGTAHAYDVLNWLRGSTDRQLRLEDAALYRALHRLEARGQVESSWGLTIMAVSALLTAVAAVAAGVPGLRAARTKPAMSIGGQQ